jgi:hypothetical protein
MEKKMAQIRQILKKNLRKKSEPKSPDYYDRFQWVAEKMEGFWISFSFPPPPHFHIQYVAKSG